MWLMIPIQFTQADPEKIDRLDAIAKKSIELLSPSAQKSLTFDFDPSSELKAWLKSNGDWKVEGWVQHTGLLCGTYQMGIRFGVGNPGCVNVEWLTEPKYATKHKQCNNVRLHHTGYADSPEVIELFDKVTCAQSLVKCTGRCAN